MEFVELAFATFAIALIITQYDGIFGVFARLRKINKLSALRCFTCTAVWIAAVLAMVITESIGGWIISTFAIVGAAIFINRVSEDLF